MNMAREAKFIEPYYVARVLSWDEEHVTLGLVVSLPYSPFFVWKKGEDGKMGGGELAVSSIELVES